MREAELRSVRATVRASAGILNNNLHKDKFFYKIAWLKKHCSHSSHSFLLKNRMAKNTEKTVEKPAEKAGLKKKLASFLGKMPLRWQPHFTKKNFIITLIVLFFLVQYWQVSSVTGGISSLSMKGSSLVDEVGQLNEMTSLFAQDLTEVRSFLGMPTRQYVSETETGDEQDSENVNENELQVALFKYVGFLGDQEGLRQRLAGNLEYLKAVFADSDLIT
ncbi:hypothetical protein KJ590_04815, partial [Patescibacteria group bacterium]|nr:hypothetical protein [Patescibacteria group bacterium]